MSEAIIGIMAPAKRSGGWSMVCCERMIKRKQGTYKKPPFEAAHCFAGGKYFRAVFVALWQPEQLCCTIILCICNHFHHIIHNYIVHSLNSPPLLQAFCPFSGHSAQQACAYIIRLSVICTILLCIPLYSRPFAQYPCAICCLYLYFAQ